MGDRAAALDIIDNQMTNIKEKVDALRKYG